MDEQGSHFRHILFYYYRQRKKVPQAHKKVCVVYRNEAFKERKCQNEFSKFRSGDLSLKNAEDLDVQLIRPISRPLSIHIVIEQDVR